MQKSESVITNRMLENSAANTVLRLIVMLSTWSKFIPSCKFGADFYCDFFVIHIESPPAFIWTFVQLGK